MALGDYRGPSSSKAFVRYVMALRHRDVVETGYRIYVTDMLQNIPQMKYLTNRWADTLESSGGKDTRDAGEIVDDIVAALGGT